MAIIDLATASRRVECRRDDFVQALRMLAAAKGTGSLRVSLSKDGELVLARTHSSASIPGNGAWAGVAEVSVRLVARMLKGRSFLPDPVVVQGADTHLVISHAEYPCRWLS
jgi:hypothetical protein